MLSVAIVTLLAALQASVPAQPALTGQLCTARNVVGTWQFTGTRPGVTSILKHITPTHFFVARIAANDVVLSGTGGTYTVANGAYTEVPKHAFGVPIEEIERNRDVSVVFQCRIDGDVMHTVGQMRERTYDEQWKRVTGASAHH